MFEVVPGAKSNVTLRSAALSKLALPNDARCAPGGLLVNSCQGGHHGLGDGGAGRCEAACAILMSDAGCEGE
eukprot:7422030-Alexandrium_andersonii.AAC.1